jgi:hypothetical protein
MYVCNEYSLLGRGIFRLCHEAQWTCHSPIQWD